MARLACLLRVSSDGQESNYSLDEQEECTKAACEAKGFEWIMQSEGAISSGAPFRPILDEVLKTIDRGELQGICVAEISRLARPENLEEITAVVGRLARANSIVLVSGRDLYDIENQQKIYYLANQQDYWNLTIDLISAGREKQLIRQRLLTVHKRLEREGKFRGAKPPFWIRDSGKTVEVKSKGRTRHKKVYEFDPVRFECVKYIIEQYKTQRSGGKVAELLNAHSEYKSLRLKGGKWDYEMIWKILRNPRLAGLEQYRRLTSRHKRSPYMPKESSPLVKSEDFPAVLSEGEWHSLLEMMGRPNDGPIMPRTPKRPLTNILHCKSCGLPMWAGGSKPDGSFVYECKGAPRLKNDQFKKCPKPQYIRSHIAHKVAFNECLTWIKNYKNRPHLEDVNTDMATQIDEIDQQLLDLLSQRKRIQEGFKFGLFTQDEAMGETEAIMQKKHKLEAQKQKIVHSHESDGDVIPEGVESMDPQREDQMRILFPLIIEKIVIEREGSQYGPGGKYYAPIFRVVGGLDRYSRGATVR